MSRWKHTIRVGNCESCKHDEGELDNSKCKRIGDPALLKYPLDMVGTVGMDWECPLWEMEPLTNYCDEHNHWYGENGDCSQCAMGEDL